MEALVKFLAEFFPGYTTMIEPVQGCHWCSTDEDEVRWEVNGEVYSAEIKGMLDGHKGLCYCNADNGCGETVTYVFEEDLMMPEETFGETYD